MHPKLFDIPLLGLPAHSFGVAIAAGFLLALVIAVRRAARFGIETDRVLELALVALVAGVLGAKLNHIVQNGFVLSSAGFVFYGGVILGGLAGTVCCRLRGLPLALMADLFAAPVILVAAFGRLGCFLYGCCFGKRGEGFPCVCFPPSSPAALAQGKPRGVPSDAVHPTQLYDAAALVVFFFVLSWVFARRKEKARGEVILLAALLYAPWRFAIELWRDDGERPIVAFGLTYSQAVSVGVFVLAGAALAFLRRRGGGER